MSSPKKTTKKEVKKKKVATKKPYIPKKQKRRNPPKSRVIQSPISPSTAIVVASEFADDAIIEAEMMGNILPYFIYSFQQDGKEVVGLTVKGVNEVVRRLGKDEKSGSKIHMNPAYMVKEEVSRDGIQGIEISVFAEDLVSGNSAWGVKFEPYKKTKKDWKTGKETIYTNTFATEKALSKAERNAKRKLIPEVLCTKMIEKLMKENPANVQKIEPPKNQMTVVKPATPQPSTQEDLENMIRKAVRNAKNQSAIIDIDTKTQESPKFSKEFKAEIHSLANSHVTELDGRQ